ncbi:hypothetical protein EVJ27_11595 [Exiguobacterium sp. SH3S2]|uniref:hypothetical protein n=1 Tax=unclassified Exiguobacterium TaxID=2644629 RepID=UPI001039D992|nr:MULTISPECIES: hypothetical protein [unclassified Exiguobacterium]TCI42881.1 hypothetical protein EVJ28_11615 [Exiguobacterium sp. SH3S3]TCI58634.1 hypothetical protein EVJ27_11595 [Exiguobacterium sp. SH3S2]
MNWTIMMLSASLLLNAFLLNIIAEQTKDIRALRRKQIQNDPLLQDDVLVATLKEKIDTLGVIPAIKYLRETYNMKLVEAKQLVDWVKERE